MSSYHRNEDYHYQHGNIAGNDFPAGEGDNSVVVDSVGHQYPSDGRLPPMEFYGHPQQVPPGEESAFDDIPDILLLNHYCSHGKFMSCCK